MEKKIVEVLQMMADTLNDEQMEKLKSSMQMVFSGCELKVNTAIMELTFDWQNDLADFLASKALEGKSVGTIKRYKYELTRLLSYINKSVGRITASDISDFMRLYKRTRNVSNQTLKGCRAVYSSFFVWLRDRDRITINPMTLVECIKPKQRIKKPFTDEEREQLLQNCRHLRDKAIMEFLYSTAVRVSEMVNLNRNDIRFSDRELIVYGKGGKERTVYINGKTHLYLKQYLESRTDDNQALFVSLNKPHTRLSKEGVENVVRECGKRAKIANCYPHRFRRTALTNALNRGMPLQEVMTLAGHVKAETTMMYCTVDKESVQLHHKKYLSA